jgi:queuine tRNA-ribosyltransferase
MFDFWIDATSGAARSGSLKLPHGTVETPVFMPVGTQATVRTLSPADLKAVGAQIVLANTYHLHVRPGEDVIAQLGGLHKFMAWERPLLTDSGGFQVFSLEGFRKVDEDGVEFQSHVDGARRKLTPEKAIEIQWTLGSDVAMAFDHVIPGGADEATARDALERTLRWLQRCAKRYRELLEGWKVGRTIHSNIPTFNNLWPIIQGGTLPALRTECLDRIMELGPWTGIAIGGSRSVSRKTRCTRPSRSSSAVCRRPCPVILWASVFRRIWSPR